MKILKNGDHILLTFLTNKDGNLNFDFCVLKSLQFELHQ